MVCNCNIKGFYFSQMEMKYIVLVFLQSWSIHLSFGIPISISPTVLPTVISPGTCVNDLDIVILIDSSGSVQSTWNTTIDNIEKFLSHFEISDTRTRVGIVEYSQVGQVITPLDSGNSLGTLYQQLEALRLHPQNGQTFAEKGLQRAAELFRGATPERYVPKVLITYTDGEPHNEGAYVVWDSALSALSEQWVTLFVVAVRKQSDTKGVDYLASRPSYLFIFDLDKSIGAGRYSLATAVCTTMRPVPFPIVVKEPEFPLLYSHDHPPDTNRPLSQNKNQTVNSGFSSYPQLFNDQDHFANNGTQVQGERGQGGTLSGGTFVPQTIQIFEPKPIASQYPVYASNTSQPLSVQPYNVSNEHGLGSNTHIHEGLNSEMSLSPDFVKGNPPVIANNSQEVFNAVGNNTIHHAEHITNGSSTNITQAQESLKPYIKPNVTNIPSPQGPPNNAYQDFLLPPKENVNKVPPVQTQNQEPPKNQQLPPVAMPMVSKQEFKCNLTLKFMQCHRDMKVNPRPLPVEIMKGESDAHPGDIGWKDFLPRFICECANKVQNRPGRTFWTVGIQNYHDCFSGPDEGRYDEDGNAPPGSCTDENGQDCSNDSKYCAGADGTNAVYTVITPEHTAIKKIEYD